MIRRSPHFANPGSDEARRAIERRAASGDEEAAAELASILAAEAETRVAQLLAAANDVAVKAEGGCAMRMGDVRRVVRQALSVVDRGHRSKYVPAAFRQATALRLVTRTSAFALAVPEDGHVTLGVGVAEAHLGGPIGPGAVWPELPPFPTHPAWHREAEAVAEYLDAMRAWAVDDAADRVRLTLAQARSFAGGRTFPEE